MNSNFNKVGTCLQANYFNIKQMSSTKIIGLNKKFYLVNNKYVYMT